MRLLFLFLVLIGFQGCRQAGKKQTEGVADNRLLRYWDGFDFADTAAVMNPEIGEQALVDFIAEFPKVKSEERSEAISHMLSKAKPHPAAFEYFITQYEHYLYDPNSPMRNDAYFQPVLEFLLDSCELNEADQYRFSERLAMVKKNKVGMKAMDFSFRLPDGSKSRLHDIHTPHILLFFYEPGCSNCQAALERLRSNRRFQELIDKDMLSVVAVYAMGDQEIWKSYQSNVPASWINGFDRDQQVISEELYDLKASPTIYLLDSNKTVVLKDSDLSQVASKLKIIGL